MPSIAGEASNRCHSSLVSSPTRPQFKSVVKDQFIIKIKCIDIIQPCGTIEPISRGVIYLWTFHSVRLCGEPRRPGVCEPHC
jgi:hypothetical protein